MPVGPYPDFKSCVSANQDKENPEGFCAYLEHQTTGKWPSESDMAAADGLLTTKTVYDVEVFATGTWTDSGGHTETFTADDLDAMVRNFQEGAPLKAGHSSDEFNSKVAQALEVPIDVVTGSDEGQGAVGLGRMIKLKRAGDRLLASFRYVPVKIAQLIKDKLYNSVSAELTKTDGGYIIRGVALLGAQRPAVECLENRLGAAKVYSFSMSEPSISDVTPVLGNVKKKNQEDKNNMAEPTTAPPTPPAAPPAAPDSAEALKAIAEALGLDAAKVTVQEIVEAIKQLTANSPSTTAAQAATGPLMSKDGKVITVEMFAATDARAKSLETEVATLKRDKRVLTFSERAKNWASLITDPAAEVQVLADLPEDKAEVVAGAYDRAYEALKKSPMFERMGAAANSNTKLPVHEFHAKVLKYATDNKVTEGEAMLKCLAADPKGYQSFMEAARADGFQSYEATHAK